MRKGATLLLNSFNDGGLLYVGDVHGSQGDGELSGIANEIEADLELEVNVLPGAQSRMHASKPKTNTSASIRQNRSSPR